ncbi:hypothetical protein N7522_009673 [Penicillium canescens]|nr:hypothetical protein N7522_009673 [Penicillium canescens]
MAVLCSGASLMFWLLHSEVLGQEERTKAIIYGQMIIGASIILGSIASIPLAVQIPLSENEIGVLLLLLVMNELVLHQRNDHLVIDFVSTAGSQ